MKYTINSVEDGIAKITYSDGSYAEIVLDSEMTIEQIDDLAYRFSRKTGTAPSDISSYVNSERTATPIPDSVDAEWLVSRRDAYGTLTEQIEYITENGIDAWQTKVASIKAQYPKS